jgi:hypothetical protein
MQIIVKSYNHLNKAFPNWDTPQGKLVKNKDHYDRLMKENGMISYEQSVENSKKAGNKPYILSKDAESIIREAKLKRNSKGQVKLDGKLGEKLVKIGAINKKIPNYMKLPSAYQPKGSFA